MQTKRDLEKQFNSDLDRIATQLISIFGLKYEEEMEELSDPLLRWQDFVLRYISPRPRQVLMSSQFRNQFNTEVSKALIDLKTLFEKGADINPYQPSGLMINNDTSARKKVKRTDLLWADWGIHHLHLTTMPIAPDSFFAHRSDWLLFCLVGEDWVCFIDVRKHSQPEVFSDPGLIEIVAKNWPEIMERFQLKGILPSSQSFAANEIKSLRRSGITPPLYLGGKAYIGPGLGLTMAATSTRTSQIISRISRYTQELAKLVYEQASQFKLECDTDEPVFSFALTQRGLAVYEEKESKAYMLPKRHSGNRENFMAELHDMILPDWALMQFLNNTTQR